MSGVQAAKLLLALAVLLPTWIVVLVVGLVPLREASDAVRTTLGIWAAVGVPASVCLVWALYRGEWRRTDRRAKGLCRACGYDLRGSPGPTCPECGAERAGRSAG